MVKIQYIPTSETVFRTLLDNANSVKNLKGSGSVQDISYFQNSSPYIRGSGWFGRVAYPIFKKYIAPGLLDLGSKVLSDVNSGKKFKSSLKSRGIESLKSTAKRILTGQGNKQPNKKRNRKIKRLKYKRSCTNKLGGRSKKKIKKHIKNKKKRVVKKSTVFQSKKHRIRKLKQKKCIFDPTFGLYN